MKTNNKNEDSYTVAVSWADMMSYWMDSLEPHLMESAHETKEHLGGLSLADYVRKQVWIVADATDRANAVAREQEKESN
jgi:hypothetical protein|tara:strand:+ start:2990 stop:3226 length:237 start_codon:yes stop_codon:yes gene_type:complete